MGMYRFVVFVAIYLFLGYAVAQDANALRELADLHVEHGKFYSALENYRSLEKERPNDLDLKFRLGVCLYQTGDVQTAEQYLLFVVNQKGGNVEAWYHLGRVYHLKKDYKNAITSYRKYIREGGQHSRNAAKHHILQCASAREIKYQAELAIVDNLGSSVNRKWDDFAPIISPGRKNTVYFSSERETNSGGLRDAEGLQDDILGSFKADIFSTELINGAWSAVRPLDDLINSSKDDIVLGFSDRATVMYYFKGFHERNMGTIFTDTLRNTDEIILPMPFKSPIKMEEGDQTPIIFNDSILIYASNQEGGYGGLDLYVTKRIMGDFWTRPENLGPQINTPYDEKCPFLAKDGRTLYFSSNQTYSLGGFDIFKAVFRDDILEWTPAQNLGAPINSPADDLYFILDNDGLTSFICSNRLGGSGGLDLYAGYFKSVQKEQLKTSNPIAFNLIDRSKEATTSTSTSTTGTTTTVSAPVGGRQEVALKPLFYNGDNVTTKENTLELNKIIKALATYPTAKVEVTGFTDDTDPEKFRLYFSYIRAEKAAAFLEQNGVNPKHIIIKGFGHNYNITKNQINGVSSSQGQKMNRRVELRIVQTDGIPLSSYLVWPNINERLSAYQRKALDKYQKGLTYKVEIATLKTMYQNDLILRYKDAMIEKDVNNGFLHYTIGWFNTYASARNLLQQMQQQGISNAFIVAYLNGVRVYKTDAEALKAKYPDLENYIKG